MAGKKKYLAKTTVDNIDGRVLQAGETITLDEAHAALPQLLQVGALEAVSGSSEPKGDNGKGDAVDINSMTKAELVKHAEDSGLVVDKEATKAELIEQISAAKEAADKAKE